LTHGTSWSVYFHDPEDNRVEIFTETPWYVPQPFAVSIDYSKAEDVIYAETLFLCQPLAGFKPLKDWKREAASSLKKELKRQMAVGTPQVSRPEFGGAPPVLNDQERPQGK
jgi:hypothetical protein